MPVDNPRLVRVLGEHAARFMELDGPWQPACVDFWRDKQCDAVRWRWSSRSRSATAEPVLDLSPPPRIAELSLRGVDDSAVGRLRSPTELSLVSDRRSLVDLSALTDLRVLSLTDRPLQALSALRLLETLSLWHFGRTELGSVQAPETLTRLRTVGWRQDDPLVVDRVPAALEELMIEDLTVSDLSGLAAAPRLRQLWITGCAGSSAAPLDLSGLSSAASLRFVSVQGSGSVLGVERLVAELPELQSLYLSPCSVEPGWVDRVNRQGVYRAAVDRQGVLVARASAAAAAGPTGRGPGR